MYSAKKKIKKKRKKDKISLECVIQYDTVENAKPFHSSPLANIKLSKPSYQALKPTRKGKIRNLKKESQAAQDR